MSVAPLLAEHGVVLKGITRRALAELAQVWAALEGVEALAARDVLLEVVPDITDRYGDLAAVSAADFYDEVRAATGARGRFAAQMASPAPAAQVQASVRDGLSPIFSVDPQRAVALSRLSGSLVRLVQQPARHTVAGSTRRDPAGPRFARKPAGLNPCDWCLMLASRGAVYWTEATAGEMNQFHDDCYCEPVPVFRDADLPEENRRLRDEWQEVTRGSASSLDARERWKRHIAETRT